MTADVQFSPAARYRAIRVLWQITLVAAWLVLCVSPLAAQQDPGEVVGSPGADEAAPSATEDYIGPAILSRGNRLSSVVNTIQSSRSSV